jgi:hypothetical protein
MDSLLQRLLEGMDDGGAWDVALQPVELARGEQAAPADDRFLDLVDEG